MVDVVNNIIDANIKLNEQMNEADSESASFLDEVTLAEKYSKLTIKDHLTFANKQDEITASPAPSTIYQTSHYLKNLEMQGSKKLVENSDATINIIDTIVNSNTNFISNFINDASFREEKSDEFIAGVKTRTEELQDNPIKIISDPVIGAWNLYSDTVNSTANNIIDGIKNSPKVLSDLYADYQKADKSEYDYAMADFASEKTLEITQEAIAFGAAFFPAKKGADAASKFFTHGNVPNYIPEGTKDFKTNWPNPEHYPFRKTSNDAKFMKAVKRDNETLGDYFNPKIITTREELFKQSNNLLENKSGAFLIQNGVDKTGLLSYLTRGGDLFANAKQINVGKMRYSDGTFSPTIVHVSGSQFKIPNNLLDDIGADLNGFDKLGNDLSAKFEPNWFNIPRGKNVIEDTIPYIDFWGSPLKSLLTSYIQPTTYNFTTGKILQTPQIVTSRWNYFQGIGQTINSQDLFPKNMSLTDVYLNTIFD